LLQNAKHQFRKKLPAVVVLTVVQLSEMWQKCVKCLHVKYPLFLSDFNETRISSTDFRKTLKYQISWKSVQWERSCSMRTDRRTDGQT
jgi:hypothetical protein